MPNWIEKFLCKFIAHQKIICYDGLTHGIVEVCIRVDCNHRKPIPSTKKNEMKYKQQLAKLKKG
jgi:hypothetical protein